MQGLVSIVVPVYNSEKTIDRCIKSILNQTYSAVEIILIDDGSTDSSRKICQKYIDSKDIHYYYQENKGVSAARNYGIQLCHGEMIGFIDSDDYVKPTYIEELYDETVDLSLCSCADTLEDGKVIKKSETPMEGVYDKINLDFIEVYKTGLLGVCWGKLFKKSLLQELEFNENLMVCEDTLLVNQYYAKAQKIKFVKNINYLYTVGNANSLNNSKYSIKLLDMHRMANEEALKCLKEDGTFTKKDLNFKRDLFLMYYADYFYYYFFQSTDKWKMRKKILSELYQKVYFKELEAQIHKILATESKKYRKILLLKKPSVELFICQIIKQCQKRKDKK